LASGIEQAVAVTIKRPGSTDMWYQTRLCMYVRTHFQIIGHYGHLTTKPWAVSLLPHFGII